MEERLCFLDFETTGVIDYINDPIEIGAILVDYENLKEITHFSSYIKPLCKQTFSEEAFKVHGIPYDAVKYALTPFQVISKLASEFGAGYRFIGWNIGFDVAFFKKMCYYSGMLEYYNNLNYRSIDIQSIVDYLKRKFILPWELYSLSNLAKFFNIPRSEKHNALECANISLQVYKNLLAMED